MAQLPKERTRLRAVDQHNCTIWKYKRFPGKALCKCLICGREADPPQSTFPDLGDKRVKRRLEMGRHQWYDNQAMLEVIQAYGRAVRAEDDKARFYVVDGSFQRLVGKCWKFVPDWFKETLPASFVPGSQTRQT